MSVIKPRTRGKQFVRVVVRLEVENYETLHAYAAFLAEKPDYVINELLDTVLAHDPEYLAWRREHGQSFIPAQTTHLARRKRRPRAIRSAGSSAEPSPTGSPSETPSDRPFFQ